MNTVSKDIWHIFQINISSGGVPKVGQGQAEIDNTGLIGDKQKNTKVHGGENRTVCIYSLERILELQAEGHAIYPGAIGENLTITGWDWSQVVPGCLIKTGAEMVLGVTKYTSPCSLLVPFL